MNLLACGKRSHKPGPHRGSCSSVSNERSDRDCATTTSSPRSSLARSIPVSRSAVLIADKVRERECDPEFQRPLVARQLQQRARRHSPRLRWTMSVSTGLVDGTPASRRDAEASAMPQSGRHCGLTRRRSPQPSSPVPPRAAQAVWHPRPRHRQGRSASPRVALVALDLARIERLELGVEVSRLGLGICPRVRALPSPPTSYARPPSSPAGHGQPGRRVGRLLDHQCQRPTPVGAADEERRFATLVELRDDKIARAVEYPTIAEVVEAGSRLERRARRPHPASLLGTVTTSSTTAPSRKLGRRSFGGVLPVTRKIVILAGVMSP